MIDRVRVGPVFDGHRQKRVVQAQITYRSGLVRPVLGAHAREGVDEDDPELHFLFILEQPERHLNFAYLVAQSAGFVLDLGGEPERTLGEDPPGKKQSAGDEEEEHEKRRRRHHRPKRQATNPWL